ncbi:MAG TPA: hypothetical protein VK403_10360 [Allosphingosinicella sp.]|nr:hypothetical protein [Allosphingosinicella sp.]
MYRSNSRNRCPLSFVTEAPHAKKGQEMGRNVTIGLGTLIVIIIVVALLF